MGDSVLSDEDTELAGRPTGRKKNMHAYVKKTKEKSENVAKKKEKKARKYELAQQKKAERARVQQTVKVHVITEPERELKKQEAQKKAAKQALEQRQERLRDTGQQHVANMAKEDKEMLQRFVHEQEQIKTEYMQLLKKKMSDYFADNWYPDHVLDETNYSKYREETIEMFKAGYHGPTYNADEREIQQKFEPKHNWQPRLYQCTRPELVIQDELFFYDKWSVVATKIKEICAANFAGAAYHYRGVPTKNLNIWNGIQSWVQLIVACAGWQLYEVFRYFKMPVEPKINDERFSSKIFFDSQIFHTNRFESYRVKKSDGKDDPAIWIPVGEYYYDKTFKESLRQFQKWWHHTSKTAHFAAERYVMRKMLRLVMSFWNEKFSVDVNHLVAGNESALPIHPRKNAFQQAARIGLYEFMFNIADVESYKNMKTIKLPRIFPAWFAYRKLTENQSWAANWLNCETGLFVQSRGEAEQNFWYLRAVCAFFTLVFLKRGENTWDDEHLKQWGGRLLDPHVHLNKQACAKIMGSNMNNPYLITL